jgi:hypothetical protein
MTGRFLGVVLLLLATSALAQRGGGGGGRGGNGMGIGDGAPSGPANRLEIFANMLKLSKDQKRDVKTILDDGQKEANPLRDQMVKSRDSIAAAVQEGKSADQVKPLIIAHAGLEGQMVEIEMKSFFGIAKTLEPDQRSQLSNFFHVIKGLFQNPKGWNSLE